MKEKTIEDVRKFWDNNPLFAGESKYETGTKDFFEEHKAVYYRDCFAGKFNDKLLIPENLENSTVLDLGCGTGFWIIEILQRRRCKALYACDISPKSIDIAKKRVEVYNLYVYFSIQNAENLRYEDKFFDHINCQGVIHHTPNPEKTIHEIARVLKKNGTAYISVYYKNFFLRNWYYISFIGKFLSFCGVKMKGRGRENILTVKDSDEIVRLFDGKDNPIGKAFTKKEIIKMVEPYFYIKRTFLFFFPARVFPFKFPSFLQKIIAKYFGFMIFLQLIKK